MNATPAPWPSRAARLNGLLLGTALGDSIGLPGEALSRRRLPRLLPGPTRQRLIGRHGMVSDDTDHAWLTGWALLAAGDDVQAFQHCLAGYLRRWFWCFPPGIGLATLRASLRLSVGVAPEHAGVNSAGNGPAMRAPLLGAVLSEHPAALAAYLTAATRLTHTHPLALQGALALARTSAYLISQPPSSQAPPADALLPLWQAPDEPAMQPWNTVLSHMAAAMARGEPLPDLLNRLDFTHGVSGFIAHSVPAALYAWWRHGHDFRELMGEILAAGGDTDTVGAMAGALAGLQLPPDELPADWQAGLWAWPWTPARRQALAQGLAHWPTRAPLPAPPWAALTVRHAVMTPVILAHGFRRLLPPW